jgi:hypothetical protein
MDLITNHPERQKARLFFQNKIRMNDLNAI